MELFSSEFITVRDYSTVHQSDLFLKCKKYEKDMFFAPILFDAKTAGIHSHDL
jgi:hypothetical protein